MNNTVYGLLLILAALHCGCSAKKTVIENKPYKIMSAKNHTTIHKEGVTLNVDFGNLKENSTVIFFDPTCVITGLNGDAFTLFAGPKFDRIELSPDLQKIFFDIPIVNLCFGDVFNPELSPKIEQPEWLSKMRKLRCLRLEDIKIKDLSFLKHTHLKQLILLRIEYGSKETLLNELFEMTSLKYLVSNNLFTPKEVSLLKDKIPGLVSLTEHQYDQKIESGEISLQD